MKKIGFISLFALLPFCFIAQDKGKPYKVLVKNLQGTYEGKSKRGLAHGKGTAAGVDAYKGTFYKGFPHGKGTYIWLNGDYYIGNWKHGKRSGMGKFVSMIDSVETVLDGYWEDDQYVAKTKPVDFKYRTLAGPKIRLSYLQSNKKGNTIEISIRRNGDEVNDSDFVNSRFISNTVTTQSSGSTSEFIIKNAVFPFKAELWFTILEENIHSNVTEVRYGIEIEVFRKGDAIIYIDL